VADERAEEEHAAALIAVVVFVFFARERGVSVDEVV
jgi:hypothetical protein